MLYLSNEHHIKYIDTVHLNFFILLKLSNAQHMQC